jgi:hypothetical protein
MAGGRPTKKHKPGGYRKGAGRKSNVSDEGRGFEEQEVDDNEELEVDDTVEDDEDGRNHPKKGRPCLNPDHGPMREKSLKKRKRFLYHKDKEEKEKEDEKLEKLKTFLK